MSARINITSDLSGHLPAVDADATQLRQMVTNLLLNASEAILAQRSSTAPPTQLTAPSAPARVMPKGDAGTIRVTTSLMIADRAYLATAHLAPELDAGRYVSLTIADTGHGIIDWSSLVPLFATTPADHIVAEHDNPSDWQRFARRTIQAMRDLGLAS